MPKVPVDFSKTIIYRLVNGDPNNNELIYVGYTTNFTKRKGQHKDSCMNDKSKKYNYPVYQKIRENGGWEAFKMIEIEKYPCNDMNEATSRERYWLEYYHAKLNTVIPSRTQEEWREENKETIKETMKEWREKNKETIKEKKKVFYETNKEAIKDKRKDFYENNKEVFARRAKLYREGNKEKNAERSKQYRESNKEAIKEKKRKYYQENKDKINQRGREAYKKKQTEQSV